MSKISKFCVWGGFGDKNGIAEGVKSCKIVFLWAVLIQLFGDFCCRMCHDLSTVHSMTDRLQDDANSACSSTIG